MQTIPAFTSQPQGITALRPVPTYTACLVTEAHRCEKLAQSFHAARPAETRIDDLLIASPTLYRQRHDAILKPPFLSLTLKRCENERNTAISLKCIVSRNSVPVYTTDVGYNSQSDLWVTACNCPMLSHSLAVLQNWLVYQRHHHQRRCRQSCTHSICQNSLCNDRSIHQRYDTTLCLCRVGGKK